MIQTTNSIKTVGLEGVKVNCECEITNGNGIHLVGLPDVNVKESLLRTVTALQSLGYSVPGKKIIINLSPTELHMCGSGYDLAIALLIIAASEQKTIPDLDKWVLLGETGLDGTLRSVSGTVQAAEVAASEGLKGVIIPKECIGDWVSLFEGGATMIYGASSISEAIDIICNPDEHETAFEVNASQPDMASESPVWDSMLTSPSELRALEIAAAGGHDIVIVGAPGSAKSNIAAAIKDILPPMTKYETLKNAKILSVTKGTVPDSFRYRPFRAPHYFASLSAMLGGGAGGYILPGEVTLANNGVLYLQEIHEMPNMTTQAIGAVMQDRKVKISRLKSIVEYPAESIVVSTLKPCPCGYYGDGDRCSCPKADRLEYLSKIRNNSIVMNSDLQLWVRPLEEKKPFMHDSAETVRQRVAKAREIQKERFKGQAFTTNAEMPGDYLPDNITLPEETREILKRVTLQLGLPFKSTIPIIKMARTIADLEESHEIQPCHIAEAASYRFLDRRVLQ